MLSSRTGRQRAMLVDEHLLLVLHTVPTIANRFGLGVYFWRSPECEWRHSEDGRGWEALTDLVHEYELTANSLEVAYDQADGTREWFAILEQVVPLLRATRHLHETLNAARDLVHGIDPTSQLQQVCDQSNEVERAIELVQADLQNSIQYSLARQAEMQSHFSRTQSVAAHRLNVLAAIFLPLATLSSVFGMNLMSGLETSSPVIFWIVMSLGMLLGAGIGVYVLKLRSLHPNQW